MRRSSMMVAMPGGELREALVAALEAMGGQDPEIADSLEDIRHTHRSGGFLLFAPTGFARDTDPEVSLLLSLRLRWTVVLVYEHETLLEAASVLGAVDGWIPGDRLDHLLPDLLTISRERYAVLPRVPDPGLGLDSLRIARFKEFDDQSRRVIERIARGETNTDIARKTRLSADRVAGIVRRGLARLGFERRLQMAVFLARTGLVEPEAALRPNGPDKG